MNADEFADAVRDENKTALSRLGSSKALYADTEGEMDDDAVLGAAATRASHAAETFESWADDESHEGARDLFADAAATEREHAETVDDERDGDKVGDAPAVQTHLREVDGTVGRLGAFVGWALAAGDNTDQVVGYFVGQASPTTASAFRDLSDDHDGHVEAAVDVLGDVADGDDWDEALAAASAAVQADYDEYFDTLEALGVNPKPVC